MAIRAEELGRVVSTSSQRVEQARVLIADDQSDVREALRLLLKAEGYITEAVSSPAAALEAVHFQVGQSLRDLGARNADYVGAEMKFTW